MSPDVIRIAGVRLSHRYAWLLLLAPALIVLAACTASTPTPATPKPAATRPPGAVASPAAKASPGTSAQASASPSPAAEPTIQIADASLADATPWVSIRLTGGEPVIVTGWRLEVGDRGATIPENAILQPGEVLTLHARAGRSSEREIFLGTEGDALALAAKPGTRVRLLDTTGKVVAESTVPRF